MEDRELRPATRWDWEQIILRARFTGLIKGRANRGGVSAPAVKAVALALASHADADGSRVFPGDGILALEAEVGIQVAQAVRRKLVEIGLIEKVRSGVRRAHGGDEYRLTLPSDLLETLDVPTPAALKLAAADAYQKRRGKRGGSNGTPTPPQEEPSMGDPVDPPQQPQDDIRGGSNGAPDSVRGGSNGASVGGPMARVTYPRPTTTTTRPSETDLDTAVTLPGANGRREEPDPVVEVEPPAPPPRPRCPEHPAMLGGLRESDGRPACPLCRATSAPRPDYRALEADAGGRLAPVIYLDRRSSA